MKLFTIGHSTRSLDDFLQTLSHYGIDMVVDIRKSSDGKNLQQFERMFLQKELPAHGIDYVSFTDFDAFQNGGYATYTQTPEFKESVRKFLTVVKGKHAAIMCAEILWFRCKRRYVAQELVSRGFTVSHIYNKDSFQDHKLHAPEIDEKMQLRMLCDDSPAKDLEKYSESNTEIKESLKKF